MTTVGSYEAKTHLPQLLDRVSRGEKILITRHGQAVAMLVPPVIDSRTKPTLTPKMAECRMQNERQLFSFCILHSAFCIGAVAQFLTLLQSLPISVDDETALRAWPDTLRWHGFTILLFMMPPTWSWLSASACRWHRSIRN